MGTEQDRKLERLLDLLAALLDARGPKTRVELQHLVPLYPSDDVAARRAFSRDIEALARMGVPVEVVDGQVPTYRVQREAYELPDPGLTDEEAAALHLALATVELDLPEGSPAESLWKLTGGAAERITPPSGSTARLPGSEHLGPLWAAVNARQPIRFGYTPGSERPRSGGGGEPREVEPWQLSCQRGHWYLQGLDRSREAQRLFRVDRIDGPISPVGATASFSRPADAGPVVAPPPWLLGDEIRYEARLWVDADQAELVRAQYLPFHGSAHGAFEVVEERPDGSVVLSVPVANPEAFRSFALTLLDHAEVLGPPEARSDLVDWLEATAR